MHICVMLRSFVYYCEMFSVCVCVHVDFPVIFFSTRNGDQSWL